MSKAAHDHQTWQQRLTLILDELEQRANSGDMSGASRDRAFNEIEQLIVEQKEECDERVKQAKVDGTFIALAAFNQKDLDKAITRGELIEELLPQLRKLRDMGFVRRRKLLKDYINEDAISAELSGEDSSHVQ